MVNDTRSGHKIKDDDSNSSKRRQIGGKGTISGSARTDASILRRSARETPLKKQTASSFSSTRKSERLEKWTPPTPLVKRKSERVEKQRISSPLRRSERGEKCRLLSSSGSKKSMKGLSSSDTKRKKGKREKSRKQLTFKPRDRSKNEKQDPKAACIIPKEKRLDARSYRAFLSPQARSARRAMKTDIELKRQDKLSQGDNNNAGTSASIEVQDGEDECSEIKREEPRKEYFARSHERHLERSSYGLRKFADGTSSNHGEVESSHFNRKRKNCPEEALESENGDGSSKCSDSPLQSSPHEETVDDAEMVQVDCSARAELQTPELIESTSEGRPLATYVDLGRGDKVGTCKTKSNTVIMYSDASVTAASKEIYSSNADTVSSSHSGSKRSNFVESCVACSKRPRYSLL
ncbi:hypothetical protein HHK36_018178 [Tetracentron sinense]|uniref:Uncharacterized protein n=1 Tax=Tetracentron sinense TaxID=13715 RepID=A0A834YVG6_TETSI|nr:hypothetical protein HHK36_018178 [Tetracentron sinense]